MADEQTPQLNEETQRLAELGRSGDFANPIDNKPAPSADPKDSQPAAEEPAKPQRPDDIPEAFWDPEAGQVRTDALLKSYRELQARFSRGEHKQPSDDPKVDDKSANKGEDDPKAGDPPPAAPALADVFSSAAAEWADTGDLGADTREAILKAGIPAEVLDNYLAGVQAQSAALTAAIYDAAGGEDVYKAAVEWARENWSQEEIEAFDNALAGPLGQKNVKLLVAEFQSANGGEGKLTDPSSGAAVGGLYTDPAEFVRDLAKADAEGDAVARRAAVQKLERSKKAGSIKGVTPRTGMRQFG